MMISPDVFFLFFKVLFFWLFVGGGEVKGQKIAHNGKNILSVELHISGTIDHMILINGTHV